MNDLRLAARSSALSRKQVTEVMEELTKHINIDYKVEWMDTYGDRDRQTSLRGLSLDSDFFTKELDTYLLDGKCDALIHSAKDLPQPLRSGIAIVALTQGLTSSDVVVLREGENLETLRQGALIATSSTRRENAVKALRHDLCFRDIRGTIQERLDYLYRGDIDGVVMAEAALIRLELNPNRVLLREPTASLQGKLAVTAKVDDLYIAELFACIDSRNKPI